MQNLGQYFTFNTSKSCRCDSFKALWSSHSVFRMNTLGENQKCERRVKRVGFHSGVMICILSCPAEVMFSMPVDTPDASTDVSSHRSLPLPHTHTHTHTHLQSATSVHPQLQLESLFSWWSPTYPMWLLFCLPVIAILIYPYGPIHSKSNSFISIYGLPVF